MKKVIKIKQSDIVKIVKSIVEQENFDDLDTKIQPEELPNDDDTDLGGEDMGGETTNITTVEPVAGSDIPNSDSLTLGFDFKNNDYYVMKDAFTENPKFILKTK